MHEMPDELVPVLKRSGYAADPKIGKLTGFRVTPCGDWKDRIPAVLQKPMGQNFLRRWDEVRKANAWDQ